MQRFRTVLFWCHLTCGVAAGFVILMMCVTGVALAYQRQIQWWADTRHFRADPPSDGRRATVAELVAAARRLDASASPVTVTWRADPAAPAAVTLGTRVVFVNPYTTAVYGDGTGAGVRAFFTTMVNWHRYVAQAGDRRPTGKAITGAANLMFLFIVLSGMYLWWPRSLRWAAVRQVIWFRRGVRGKARDFNWHNTLGFWSAAPLALVVYSATVISYPWSSNLVYRALGEDPPAPAATRAAGPVGGTGTGGPAAGKAAFSAATASGGLDGALAVAMAFQADWNILALRLPWSPDAPVVVTLDRGDGGQPHLRGTLTIDSSGEIDRWEGAESLSPGRKVRNFLRFAHTGEIAGLAGQTVAGLVSAAGAVLVYTGITLACRRCIGWLRRTGARAENMKS
jgi:uncharacterized iron-regulated membrane protein